MKINDKGTSNAAHWHERAMKAEARIKPLEETVAAQYAHNVLLEVRLAEAIECCTIKDNRNLWLEIRLQKIMARCADLLDEDQFNELDAMVGGICDAWVIAPAQKTLTDLARETNYQPSRYEAHLEARLADAEALLRDARSSIPGNAKFTLRRIDDFLRAGVTTVTVAGGRDG